MSSLEVNIAQNKVLLNRHLSSKELVIWGNLRFVVLHLASIFINNSPREFFNVLRLKKNEIAEANSIEGLILKLKELREIVRGEKVCLCNKDNYAQVFLIKLCKDCHIYSFSQDGVGTEESKRVFIEKLVTHSFFVEDIQQNEKLQKPPA